jgi:hypothetical protein
MSFVVRAVANFNSSAYPPLSTHGGFVLEKRRASSRSKATGGERAASPRLHSSPLRRVGPEMRGEMPPRSRIHCLSAGIGYRLSL